MSFNADATTKTPRFYASLLLVLMLYIFPKFLKLKKTNLITDFRIYLILKYMTKLELQQYNFVSGKKTWLTSLASSRGEVIQIKNKSLTPSFIFSNI